MVAATDSCELMTSPGGGQRRSRTRAATFLLLLTLASCAKVSGSGEGMPDGGTGSDLSHIPDLIFRPDVNCAATVLACGGPACGNSRIDPPSETCDDGNHTGGDGCSAACQLETDWVCQTPGS